MRRLLTIISLALASILPVHALNNECLIVRNAEGHRFRDSMIAGVLTGGVGFVAGAAFGGAKYEYVDSFNVPDTKMKYKGGELQKLQQSGVHIIVVNKKATSDEMQSARTSCSAPAIPSVVPVSASQSSPTQPAAQPTLQPAVSTSTTTIYQEQSLGDAARQAKAQKAAQQSQQPPQQ